MITILFLTESGVKEIKLPERCLVTMNKKEKYEILVTFGENNEELISDLENEIHSLQDIHVKRIDNGNIGNQIDCNYPTILITSSYLTYLR